MGLDRCRKSCPHQDLIPRKKIKKIIPSVYAIKFNAL
jgi:hypothetical protein